MYLVIFYVSRYILCNPFYFMYSVIFFNSRFISCIPALLLGHILSPVKDSKLFWVAMHEISVILFIVFMIHYCGLVLYSWYGYYVTLETNLLVSQRSQVVCHNKQIMCWPLNFLTFGIGPSFFLPFLSLVEREGQTDRKETEKHVIFIIYINFGIFRWLCYHKIHVNYEKFEGQLSSLYIRNEIRRRNVVKTPT